MTYDHKCIPLIYGLMSIEQHYATQTLRYPSSNVERGSEFWDRSAVMASSQSGICLDRNAYTTDDSSLSLRNHDSSLYSVVHILLHLHIPTSSHLSPLDHSVPSNDAYR